MLQGDNGHNFFKASFLLYFLLSVIVSAVFTVMPKINDDLKSRREKILYKIGEARNYKTKLGKIKIKRNKGRFFSIMHHSRAYFRPQIHITR